MLENGKDEPPGAVALEGLFVTPYPTPGGGNACFRLLFYPRPVDFVGRALVLGPRQDKILA